VKTNAKDVKWDIMKSGLTFKTGSRIEGKDPMLPTTCRMQRP